MIAVALGALVTVVALLLLALHARGLAWPPD